MYNVGKTWPYEQFSKEIVGTTFTFSQAVFQNLFKFFFRHTKHILFFLNLQLND